MTDKKDVLRPSLWTPRPVNETIAVYADWADNYDAEITSRGYRTPDRLAAALSKFVTAETPILDFGCGTGIGGAALIRAGFRTIDGDLIWGCAGRKVHPFGSRREGLQACLRVIGEEAENW